MQILNIAGYKFTALARLPELRSQLLDVCKERELKGTILLSAEGINLSLAGAASQVESFKAYMKDRLQFFDMEYRESVSAFLPFKRMKVKLKKEIITMKCPEVQPGKQRALSISPEEFKQWMDEERDITILDTRNDYEVRFGTFKNAINLRIEDFSEFPEAAKKIDPAKPVVMFCTGGIRCEKAAISLQNSGAQTVYQLEGGILNYFAKEQGAHYDGECFVFDERVSLDPKLQTTGTLQCLGCQGPIAKDEQVASKQFCSVCINHC